MSLLDLDAAEASDLAHSVRSLGDGLPGAESVDGGIVAKAGVPPGKWHVLVVDDSKPTQRILAHALTEKLGVHAIAVSGGEDALHTMRTEQVDLLLLDIAMPGMSGHQLLRIMKQDAALAVKPVIMISGDKDEEAVARSMELGAVDYMTKPIQRDPAMKRVAAALWNESERRRKGEAHAGTVLCVDDSPTTRKILSKALSSQGYAVLVASSGEECLQIVRDRAVSPALPQIDVILLDIVMPGMGGYETLRHLKEDPRLAGIPVIVFSTSDNEVMRDCLNMGADECVDKTAQREVILARVRGTVERARVRKWMSEHATSVALPPGSATESATADTRSSADAAPIMSPSSPVTGRSSAAVDPSVVEERIPSSYVIADPNQPDCPIVHVSEGFVRLTGYSACEALGRNCRFLQGAHSDSATLRSISDAVRNGRECVASLVNYRKDGTPFGCSLHLLPIVDDAGKLLCFVGLQRECALDAARKQVMPAPPLSAAQVSAVSQLMSAMATLVLRAAHDTVGAEPRAEAGALPRSPGAAAAAHAAALAVSAHAAGGGKAAARVLASRPAHAPADATTAGAPPLSSEAQQPGPASCTPSSQLAGDTASTLVAACTTPHLSAAALAAMSTSPKPLRDVDLAGLGSPSSPMVGSARGTPVAIARPVPGVMVNAGPELGTLAEEAGSGREAQLRQQVQEKSARIQQLEAQLMSMDQRVSKANEVLAERLKQLTTLFDHVQRLMVQVKTLRERNASLTRDAAARGYIPSFFSPSAKVQEWSVELASRMAMEEARLARAPEKERVAARARSPTRPASRAPSPSDLTLTVTEPAPLPTKEPLTIALSHLSHPAAPTALPWTVLQPRVQRPPTGAQTPQPSVQVRKIEAIFRACELVRANSAEMKRLVREVCGLPSYFARTLFQRVKDIYPREAGAAAGACTDASAASPLDAADSAPSITCAEFLHFWAVHMEYALDKTAKFWRALRQPGATAILRSDLEEVVQAIVDYHPDLQDLRENEQLRAWYVTRCVVSIFQSISRRWNEFITWSELKSSNLVDAFYYVDGRPTKEIMPFSRQEFDDQVAAFREMAQKDATLVSKADLRASAMYSLTDAAIDRVFSGAPRRLVSGKPGFFSFEDFLWFNYAEKDRMADTSVDYWFRCLDLDADNTLSHHDLAYFFFEKMRQQSAAQAVKGEEAGEQEVSEWTKHFHNLLCQVTDLTSPASLGRISALDVRRCKAGELMFDAFLSLTEQKRSNFSLL